MFLQNHDKLVVEKGCVSQGSSLGFVHHPKNSGGTTGMPYRNFSPVHKHMCNGNPHIILAFFFFFFYI